MRRTLPVLAFALLIVGCAGSTPYTQTDLNQVRSVYRVLVPDYQSFKSAYLGNNYSAMTADFHTEKRVCRTVDAIDRRDTISPNVKLFLVSEGLDNLCNSIEYAYATWRHERHMSYDESLNLGSPADLFVNADASLEQMPGELRHPSAPV
jgi:hypothetical protein